MVEYIEVIEDLRKKKMLSMQAICGDLISHASYSRFKNKSQVLSINKMLYIMHQLDLSFREATLFNLDAQTVNEEKILLSDVLQVGDIEEMSRVAKYFDSKVKEDYDAYALLSIQLRLEIGGEIERKQISDLKHYLFSIDNWSHREMYLFSFILYQSESIVIETTINRLFEKAAPPFYLEINLNLIILIGAAHLEILNRQELRSAEELMRKLEALAVHKKFYTVQAFVSINRVLHTYAIKKQTEDYRKICRIYRNFKSFDLTFLAHRLEKHYIKLETVYDLPTINWNE